MQYMPAVLLAHAKEVRDDGSIVEIVVWELPESLPPSTHRYKYRLYFGASGLARVRYDNERGKGDHRHIGNHEEEYRFVTLEQLLEDFKRDVEAWRRP
jgi:uncharacterized protein DUF6516